MTLNAGPTRFPRTLHGDAVPPCTEHNEEFPVFPGGGAPEFPARRATPRQQEVRP